MANPTVTLTHDMRSNDSALHEIFGSAYVPDVLFLWHSVTDIRDGIHASQARVAFEDAIPTAD